MTKALNEATKKFRDGHKPAGIVGIDPIMVDVLDLGETQGSSLTLKQKYDHVKVTGMSACNVATKKAVFKDDECHWQMGGTCPLLELLGHYTLEGKILVFPLNSQGPSNVTFADVNILFDMKCEKHEKNNKKHIRITDLNVDVSPSVIRFDYLNLVPGNEDLSNHMLEVFNENSLTLYNDVKPSLNRALAVILKHVMSGPFAKIPEDELFLD